MTQKYLIDSIEITDPCNKPWSEMTGSETKRFCNSCEKDVYNLSAMSRRRANRLLRNSGAKICVRYARLQNGKTITSDRPLYKISKRSGAIAAGVIAATLSVSAVSYAQGGVALSKRDLAEQPSVEEKLEISSIQSPALEGDISQISFSVFDVAGEPLPGARVSLTENETERYFFTTTDGQGIAQFSLLPKASFELKIEYPGFETVNRRIRVSMLAEPEVEITLKPSDYARYYSEGEHYEIPVFKAIEDGDFKAFKEAVDSGFDVNTRDSSKKTALHLAVENLAVKFVELLVTHGADVNAKDSDDETAITLLATDVGEGEENVGKILKILIENDADLNAANSEGDTILMESAYYDDPEIVTMLLDAGADTSLKNEDEETAYKRIEDESIWEIFHRYGIFQ